MANGGAKRRFSSVALVALTSLIICGIATPIIVSIGSDRITVGSGRLVAAPRDSVLISTPTPLGQSRIVTIERGLLFPADASGRALDTPLSKSQMTGGSARLVIEDGVFRLLAERMEATAEPSAPLLDALSALQFEALELRRATVHMLLPDGRTETISGIDGELTHRRKATLLVKGKGELRGQRVAFDASAGVLNDLRPGSTVPLRLSLKGNLLEATFDGKVGFIGPAQMQGAVDFKMPQLRQAARWFGAPWTSGSGLRDLSGQAQLSWSGPALAFNRGTFQIDGNEASGTLNLNFTNARPSIGGTLALKSLDLGRYFPGPALSLPTGGANSLWTRLLGTEFNLPLATHFDADLRLSADKVKFGAVQFGRSAAAVTVSQGRMLADIGAFEFDGGRGNGQISADMSAATPKITIRGRLDEIDASRIANGLFGHPVVSGKATITADMSSTGKTGSELFNGSQGRLQLAIRNGGKLGIDLRGLASATVGRAADGWGNAGRGQSSFDTLDASMAVRAGALIAEDVKVKIGDATMAFAGQIDVPTNRLSIGVEQLPVALESGRASAAAPLLSLQIFGPWAAPTIRNDGGRERAADPSLPNGVPAARL